MLQPMCILYVWRGLTVEWRRRALEIRPAQTLRLHLLLSYVSKLAVRIAHKTYRNVKYIMDILFQLWKVADTVRHSCVVQDDCRMLIGN